MTTNELWAKFVEWMKSREGYPFAGQFVNTMWTAYQAAHASRDAEVEALRKDVARLRKDADRINWLALHPRGAKITIEDTPQDCIFWGISSAPNNTLREAIDAAMQEKQL